MLLDTYAWVEFFRGTKKGAKVKEVLEQEFCYTCIISLAEITKWCLKNNLTVIKYIEAIQQASVIIPLSNAICALAGKICFETKKEIKDFGMMDALILATAQASGLKVLTGDKHFRDFSNTIML